MTNMFPDYSYRNGKNFYKDEEVGRGGFVWAKPGMYGRTYTFDVRSMHPSSIIALNYFGEYTERFEELTNARAAIKHKDFETAKKMLDGKLAPYLDDPSKCKAISNALKTAINSVYGLSSASFDNPMRHPKNVNNIVALRGALFMAMLRDELISKGAYPIHIKTDSIKVLDPSEDIRKFIMNFGLSYGYEFEIEHIFDRICLVNDAVYIAKLAEDDPEDPGKWTATGAQFQHPYIFKTLFSKEPIVFEDMCETKSVTTALYLDMNEGLFEDEHDYVFIGKVGSFCPIMSGKGGGLLLRTKEDKYYAVGGSKGYRWLEAETIRGTSKEEDIDRNYYNDLVAEAISGISNYGDFEKFVSEDPFESVPPWESVDEVELPF